MRPDYPPVRGSSAHLDNSPLPVRLRIESAADLFNAGRLPSLSIANTPVRGGIIEQDGSRYRIDGLLPSSVAGIVD